jgi:putative ABC transport system ATP-binding protein
VKRSEAGVAGFIGWFKTIIGPDSRFVWTAIIYGVGISLLWLATPISVQLLINSVASTDVATPLISLSLILFGLLALLGTLMALRLHLIALLERRIFTRIVAEITLRTIHARNPFFEEEQRRDLFNRYFDMIMAQKSLPSLLIGLFAILLEGTVGLVVTSFYHSYVFLFNVMLVVVLLVIWRIWAHEAIWTAVQQSEAKHRTAHWIQSLADSSGFFKSSRHIDHAIARSEYFSAHWVDRHKNHFRQYMGQSIAFLATFAVANAGFLALGGSLIISGQLSLGQLVAAELILSGIFYGIAQVTTYLPTLYEFAANLEETTRFWDVEQEQLGGSERRPTDGALTLRQVQAQGHSFDFAVAAGEQIGVVAAPDTRRALTALIKRHNSAERGLVLVGNRDIADFDLYKLRAEVIVCDRVDIVEMSIRNYLELACGNAEGDRDGNTQRDESPSFLDLLTIVGLDRRIETLDRGLDTVVSTSGWPLTVGETMALQLVAAMIARPRVLLLSPLYDLLPTSRVDAALDWLRGSGTTVLQFTRRPDELNRDGFIAMGRTSQHRVDTVAALMEQLEAEGGHVLAV